MIGEVPMGMLDGNPLRVLAIAVGVKLLPVSVRKQTEEKEPDAKVPIAVMGAAR